jgi:hypothetical protein
LSGNEGLIAMAAGCGISLFSAALAGGLLTVAGGETPEARMQRAFLAMVVRLAVVVALGLAARSAARWRGSRCCSGSGPPTWRCSHSK